MPRLLDHLFSSTAGRHRVPQQALAMIRLRMPADVGVRHLHPLVLLAGRQLRPGVLLPHPVDRVVGTELHGIRAGRLATSKRMSIGMRLHHDPPC